MRRRTLAGYKRPTTEINDAIFSSVLDWRVDGHCLWVSWRRRSGWKWILFWTGSIRCSIPCVNR